MSSDPIDLDRIVIVGASLAGLTAAATFRAQGWDGDLVVVEASATMPSDRPPLSKQVLAGTLEPAAAISALTDRIDGLDVDIRLDHRVAGAGFAADDLRLKFFNDHEITADGVVIATGSAARWPAGFLVETEDSTANEPKYRPRLAGVHVIRTLDDSLALKADLDSGPNRLVVIGAGFIGAEVAATARAAGVDVTMVEYAPLPLARVLGGMVGEFVADLHRDNGVDLRLGVGLDEIVEGAPGRVGAVTLTDGSRIDADVVVLGLGAAPELDWLGGSGLVVDNGVVCDETLWAGPGVVAAGDVASWVNTLFGERMRVEHWENAIEQGEAAAKRLLAAGEGSDGEPFASVPWFWSDQYDCKIQMAGRPAADDEIVLIDGDPADRRFAVAFRRGDRCTGVFAANRPRIAVVARMRMAESLDWSHVVP
ncbi:MAG TPA: FAD-dependent oxidoreductase [Microthrixaceae bacterium]|nr:FAD-dependent oxidoreductase [Microthrixaceae bacterium]HNI36043.1 FAD-dependent oxidoreductase [Microthrixaceae bacterium]